MVRKSQHRTNDVIQLDPITTCACLNIYDELGLQDICSDGECFCLSLYALCHMGGALGAPYITCRVSYKDRNKVRYIS